MNERILFEGIETNDDDAVDDILNEDDENETNDEEKEDEDKEDEDELNNEEDEEDKNKDKKKEDDELDDEDDEDEKLLAPPRWAEIKKEFPELARKFPYVKNALFRDKAYQEVFSDIDEAKEAASAKKDLESFGKDLSNGDITKVLNTVKQKDPKAFDVIVDDYLVQLHKVDTEAYRQVAGNVIKLAVADVLQLAKDTEKEEDRKELENIAKKFYSLVFNSNRLENISRRTKPRSKSDDKEDEKLNREREEFETQRRDTAIDDVTEAAQNRIISTIRLNIDKRGVMPDYVKEAAIKEVYEILEDELESDEHYKRNNNSLWKVAKENKYDKQSKDKIIKAYLGRSKSLLPDILKKVRNKALKGISKREEKDRTGPLPRGRDRNSTSSGKSGRDLKKGESITDYFMSED